MLSHHYSRLHKSWSGGAGGTEIWGGKTAEFRTFLKECLWWESFDANCPLLCYPHEFKKIPRYFDKSNRTILVKIHLEKCYWVQVINLKTCCSWLFDIYNLFFRFLAVIIFDVYISWNSVNREDVGNFH